MACEVPNITGGGSFHVVHVAAKAGREITPESNAVERVVTGLHFTTAADKRGRQLRFLASATGSNHS